MSDKRRNKDPISHMVHDGHKWQASRSKGAPYLNLVAEVATEDYRKVNRLPPKTKKRGQKITVMADTGCASCLAGPDFMSKLGVTKSELIKTKNLMRAINRSRVELMGVMLVKFSGMDNSNNIRSTKQVVYISESCKSVYLSREACEQLGLISQRFPKVGNHNEDSNQELGATSLGGDSAPRNGQKQESSGTTLQVEEECTCPERGKNRRYQKMSHSP